VQAAVTGQTVNSCSVCLVKGCCPFFSFSIGMGGLVTAATFTNEQGDAWTSVNVVIVPHKRCFVCQELLQCACAVLFEHQHRECSM
jgi:hypothetical protein